jgi:hypothetical protein
MNQVTFSTGICLSETARGHPILPEYLFLALASGA